MSQPISLGALIDRTWDLYRARFTELLSISGWILIVTIIDIVALIFYPSASNLLSSVSLTGWETFGVTLFAISNVILAPLLTLWVYIALVRLIATHGEEKRVSLKKIAKDSLRYFFPTLWVSILVFFVVLGAIVLPIAPAYGLAWLTAWIAADKLALLSNLFMITGVVLALVLTVRWIVRYYMSNLAVLLDDSRGGKALTRSRTLIQGRFWSSLVLIVIPKVLFVFIGFVAVLLLTFAAEFAFSALAGLDPDVQARLGSLTTTFFPALIAVFINPLFVLSDIILYQKLKGGVSS